MCVKRLDLGFGREWYWRILSSVVPSADWLLLHPTKADFCRKGGWMWEERQAAKCSPCSEMVSWRGVWGVQGCSPSQALIYLLLAPFLRHKQTPGNIEVNCPCTAGQIQAMMVNAILISWRDCVQGMKWCRGAHKDQTCLPGHSEAEDMFCACANVKFQWSDKGQLVGPEWYKKDMRGWHGFPAESFFIFSWVLFLTDLLLRD